MNAEIDISNVTLRTPRLVLRPGLRGGALLLFQGLSLPVQLHAPLLDRPFLHVGISVSVRPTLLDSGHLV